MRKLVAVVMAAGLLASLAAGSSAPQLLSSCDTGANAALVTAKGAFGDDPKADFPTPLVSKKAQIAVASRGDGKPVVADQGVNLIVSVYDGATGEAVPTQSGPITALTVRLFVDNSALPFSQAMTCATVGSRVITTGSAAQLLGPENGLAEGTTLVIVADIESAFLGRANGADQVPQAGYPSVVLAPDGRPGLTFSTKDIPEGLGGIALKQGGGAIVKQGDSVIANLTGVVWGAKTTFASSWDNNAPMTVTAAELDAQGVGLVPGLAKAVIGQKVGSQLLVVVPPREGYGTLQPPAGVTASDTLVYVFDILGISQ